VLSGSSAVVRSASSFRVSRSSETASSSPRSEVLVRDVVREVVECHTRGICEARKRVSTGNLNRGGGRRTTNPQPLQVVSSDRSCCEFTGDGLNGLLGTDAILPLPPPAVDSQRLTCREYKPHPHGVLRKPPLPHRTSDHVRRPMVPSPKSRIPSRRIGRCADNPEEAPPDWVERLALPHSQVVVLIDRVQRPVE